MKPVLVLTLTIALTLGGPALSDTVSWLDRCLVKVELNKKKPAFEAYDVTASHCIGGAFDICEFSVDSAQCYGALKSDYEDRSRKLMNSFPASIEETNASALRKRSYPRLLNNLSEPKEVMCPTNRTLLECDTLKAGVKFGEVLVLRDYLSNVYEEIEETE